MASTEGERGVNILEVMRRDWDERARRDALRYIATWRQDWDPASFFASGEEDYQRFVEAVFARWLWEPQGKAMLELGCGAGRMTHSFAQRFARVYACDISPQMLERAKALLPDAANINWLQGDGKLLAGVESASVDFIFSYIVLQHLPTAALIFQYVCEMLRVLKPQGAFLFQFNSTRTPTMNRTGRLAWGVVDAMWTLRLNRASRALAAWMGFDPAMAGKSWRGASVEVGRMREALQSAGGILQEVTGADTPMTWFWGRKALGSVR